MIEKKMIEKQADKSSDAPAREADAAFRVAKGELGYDARLQEFCDFFAEGYSAAETSQPGTRTYMDEEEHLIRGLIHTVLDTKDSAPIRVLDLGCGDGRYERVLYNYHRVEIYPVDVSFGMLRKAKRATGYPFVQAAASHLPFQDAFFDAVLLSFGLISFAGPKAIAEAARVLVPGGYGFFSAYNSEGINVIAGKFRTGQAKTLASINPDRGTMIVCDRELDCRAYSIWELEAALEAHNLNVIALESHLGLPSVLSPGCLHQVVEEIAGARLQPYFATRLARDIDSAFCRSFHSGMYLSAVCRKAGLHMAVNTGEELMPEPEVLLKM